MAYIEIPHTFIDTQPYKTFNLPNDSSARTLQDVKFPERGGGFGFASSNQLNSNVRNRFLYWRWCNGGLEVLEDSLDTTLRSNWLKFIFSNSCVLHAEAFERESDVHLLVCTASSAVRLLFKHPNVNQKEGCVGRTAPSIFHEVDGLRRSVIPVRALQQPGQLRCATARVRASDGSALFAFCLTTGSVLLVEMPPPSAAGDEEEPVGSRTFELRYSSMMGKLWSGIVPSFASRSDGVSQESATDALFLDSGRPTLLLTVCRDHKLRVWNLESRDLVMVTDLIDCLDFKVDVKALQLKSQGHSLRQSQGGSDNETIHVGVHLNFVNISPCLLLFAVNDNADDIHSCLVLLNTFACSRSQDIVDWCIVPDRHQAWLLLQAESGYSLSCQDVREPGSPPLPALFLSDVLWEEEEEEDDGEEGAGALSCVAAHQDPQEAYLAAVFTPGRFSALAISRALTALRQRSEVQPPGQLSIAGPTPGSSDALKEEIIALVEERISQTLAEQCAAQELSSGSPEISEAEMLQIRMMHWADFFASVSDYQRTSVSRPVGLLVDRNTGLVGLVRKAGLSLFREADLVEVCAFAPVPRFRALEGLNRSTCILLRHVRYLQQCVGVQALAQLYSQLETDCEDLSAKAAAFLQECLRFEHEQELLDRLSATDNLFESFVQMLEIAENLQDIDILSDESDGEDMLVGAYTHPERFLFASPLATDGVARSVGAIMTARLRLAASLLLVQQLLTSPGSSGVGGDWLTGGKPSLASRLKGQVRQRLLGLLRNLTFMRWLTCVRLTAPPGQVMNRLSSQLGLLGCPFGPKSYAPSPADFQRTLLELFYQTVAGDRVRSRLRETGLLDSGSTEPAKLLWTDVFPVASSCLQAQLCPSSADVVLILCQFLFSRGQLQTLLKLTSLLQGWWARDPVLISFVRGLALLNTGQPRKGLYFITRALDALPTNWERPGGCSLPRAALGPKANLQKLPHLLQVNISLKVMRALEILEEPLLVVELAHHAFTWLRHNPLRSSFLPLNAAEEEEMEGVEKELSPEEEEEQLRSVLWTAIFKHELAVGRNREAFLALQWNPDPSSRKDCLRQLIVTMCDRRQLAQLVNFEYGEMEEDFLSILESRARAVDLNTFNYYHLLYAFHVNIGAYRRAALAMYELAVRLGLEVRTLSGLQGQARAFLSALTALPLVQEDSQWLVRPQLVNGELPEEQVVVELSDIRKEYALVKARLRMAQVDLELAQLPAGPLSVCDTTRCLLKAGLYNLALEISQMFEQPLMPIFEALTSRCVALPMASTAASSTRDQRDLQLEKEFLMECLGDAGSELACEGLAPVQLAWSLLQTYLQTHADGGYWHCVVAKLLACRLTPPAWLVAEGKRRKPGALLRLYIINDEVEAAFNLALEIVDDAMSRGGGPSVATEELTCLPHMWLRQLCTALNHLATQNALCATMGEELETRLRSYYSLLQRTARDKEMLRSQAKQRVLV